MDDDKTSRKVTDSINETICCNRSWGQIDTDMIRLLLTPSYDYPHYMPKPAHALIDEVIDCTEFLSYNGMPLKDAFELIKQDTELCIQLAQLIEELCETIHWNRAGIDAFAHRRSTIVKFNILDSSIRSKWPGPTAAAIGRGLYAFAESHAKA